MVKGWTRNYKKINKFEKPKTIIKIKKTEKKLNNLKRLKPREYKEISDQEKNEI